MFSVVPSKNEALFLNHGRAKRKLNVVILFLKNEAKTKEVNQTCCRIVVKRRLLVQTLIKIERRTIGVLQRFTGTKRNRSEPLLNFLRSKWNKCLR